MKLTPYEKLDLHDFERYLDEVARLLGSVEQLGREYESPLITEYFNEIKEMRDTIYNKMVDKINNKKHKRKTK